MFSNKKLPAGRIALLIGVREASGARRADRRIISL